MSISSDSDFQIHLKRKPNASFINNVFVGGLQAWKVNIDMQPVVNHYKAVTYMCSYFSEAEDETSDAMEQAAKEAFSGNKSHYEKMKAIVRAYATKRKCSFQEAVYLVMPELWLRKIFPKVIFLNSNLPDKQYRLFKKKNETDVLPDDNNDLFQRNMLVRYLDRPSKSFKNGAYKVIGQLCYAEFLSYYYIVKETVGNSKNDCQPVFLDDAIMESNHAETHFPKVVTLMTFKEKLHCQKVNAVLRYHQSSSTKHMLFSLYPFLNEEPLKFPPFMVSYVTKLQEPGVMNIINRNRSFMVPFSEIVEET